MGVNERREIELKNRDKTVHKMSRDGLVEENLAQGTQRSVTQREKDFDPARPAAETEPHPDSRASESKRHGPAHRGRDAPEGASAPDPPTEGGHRPHHDNRRYAKHEQATADAPPSEDGGAAAGQADGPDTPGADDAGVDGGRVKYERESKLRKAESKFEKAEAKLDKAKKKQPKKKKLRSRVVFDEDAGKSKRQLYFEDVPKTPKKGIVRKSVKGAGNLASAQFHRKMYQVENDNVGTKAAHRTEVAGETAVRGVARHKKNRIQKAYNRTVKMEKRVAKAEGKLSFERTIQQNPELQRKNAVQKHLHKRRLQKQFIKQAKKEAKKQAAHGGKKVVQTGAKAVKSVAGAVARHPVAVTVAAVVVLLAMLFLSMFGAVGSMVGQGGTTMLAGTYLPEDEELNQAELYYTERETDLYFEAYGLQASNPGYDEYRFNIGELGHNPYELMAYLNARFNEFAFDGVQAELDAIFAQQYQLWTEVIVEIRTREVELVDPDTGEIYIIEEEYEYKIFSVNVTSNLLSGILTPRMSSDENEMYQTLMLTRGNRFYFSPPFDDFSWTHYMSDGYGYRVHPIDGTKDFHKAVDIAVPGGTPIKAVQNGVVSYAGFDDSYGNYVVIEDSEGLKSLYAHCASLSVSTGQTVQRGDEIGKVGTTGSSTGNHLHLEVYRNGVSLNPTYFVDPGKGYLEGPGGGEYPGEPYDDETYARLMAEATKYIGWPYVFGGGSPTTGFDCSGFVSWAFTASGVKNTGHLTAQGLYNQCAPVSEPRPGDLVFFHSTYSTSSLVTHVGIYVGNGQMLHCGNPIGYTDLSYSYWQTHFLCYGRLV